MDYFRLLSVFFIAFSFSVNASEQETLESELKHKCEVAFDILAQDDGDKFLAMLPKKPVDAEERKNILQYVNTRHKRYMVRDKGWESFTYKKVKFDKPQQKYIDQYGATKMAWSFFKIIHKNEKKTQRTAQCTFIKTGDNWHLVKLP